MWSNVRDMPSFQRVRPVRFHAHEQVAPVSGTAKGSGGVRKRKYCKYVVCVPKEVDESRGQAEERTAVPESLLDEPFLRPPSKASKVQASVPRAYWPIKGVAYYECEAAVSRLWLRQMAAGMSGLYMANFTQVGTYGHARSGGRAYEDLEPQTVGGRLAVLGTCVDACTCVLA